jgi:multidrug efflux pump subunit AcrA (membrane-fusion protein)
VQAPATLYLDLTDNTVAFNSVNLVARVQGYLESIDYKDGAAVEKGTELFGIERDVYQAQLDQAKAQSARDEAVLKEAQVDLARYQQLAKTNAIPKQQEQDQQYTVEQDEATVKLDQANVETANITLAIPGSSQRPSEWRSPEHGMSLSGVSTSRHAAIRRNTHGATWGRILGHVRSGTLIKAEDKPKATGLGAGRSKP